MGLDRLFRGTDDIRAYVVNIIFRTRNWPRIFAVSDFTSDRNIKWNRRSVHCRWSAKRCSVENSILCINNIANNVKSECTWSHFVLLRHLDVEHPNVTRHVVAPRARSEWIGATVIARKTGRFYLVDICRNLLLLIISHANNFWFMSTFEATRCLRAFNWLDLRLTSGLLKQIRAFPIPFNERYGTTT